MLKNVLNLTSSLPIDTKKCSFSDNICKTIDKSCVELEYSIDATEETCKTATTSSPNIKCIYKNRCIQANIFDKTDDNDDTSDNKKSDKAIDDDESEDNDVNYSKQNYLNKLLAILLCVMV